MHGRIVTISITVALFLIAFGMVAGERTPLVMFPEDDGNIMRARVRFLDGTPVTVTQQAIEQIRAANFDART